MTFFGTTRWYGPSFGTDLRGRVFALNLIRPVTRWRRFRAWVGWHERDSLVMRGGK